MKQNRKDFWKAVGDGSTRRVLNCLKSGLDINMRMYGGFTALHRAIKLGDLEMVNYLVKHGADMNELSQGKKETPIELADRFEHPEIKTLLMELGAKTSGELLHEKEVLIKSEPWTKKLNEHATRALAEANIMTEAAFLEWQLPYSAADGLDKLQREMKGLPTKEEERRQESQREKEEQRERLADAGFKEWNDVVRVWSECLRHYGLSAGDTFREIKISAAPLEIFGDPIIEDSWWEKKEIDECRRVFQEICDNHQKNTSASCWDYLRPQDINYEFKKGELLTLEYLWDAKDSEAALCAVLIRASFVSRDNPRARRGGPWKCESLVSDLFSWVRDVLEEAGTPCHWHHSSTSALPWGDSPYFKECSIESLRGVIWNLAEEHAALLHKYQPIYITRTPERDPDLDRAIKKRHERIEGVRLAREQEWEALQKEREAKRSV